MKRQSADLRSVPCPQIREHDQTLGQGHSARTVADTSAGDLAGNLTGNLAANVAGNLVPNVAGNMVPSVAGNLVANVAGKFRASRTGERREWASFASWLPWARSRLCLTGVYTPRRRVDSPAGVACRPADERGTSGL